MDAKIIDNFEKQGAILLKGVFKEWVNKIISGIERNLVKPSKYANENNVKEGRFFDDYCNWTRIKDFKDFIENSEAAKIAAEIMKSTTAQFFHDHVLVKEGGTSKETPWHQDAPYYFVNGSKTVSMWIPVDPIIDTGLRFISGSHKWEKMVRPVSWSDDSDFYNKDQEWLPVPNPDLDPQNYHILEWSMEPGDVVLFDFRAVHGARGNKKNIRRRALSLRWVGDDVTYIERPGRTSPPFPGHGMETGQKLREDWFPIVYTKS
jgi:ectoine hydroxylase-related dioxygenase (phytanoyl-CoA dioxygenase family)|tara:strand:- start:1275 stop:2060 length:786 start_codon:yes stop_codon:yes gene_type:complete